jgi:Tat protein translocase TatB subunit
MNLGFPEMVFLFVLGLLLFGPKKLPEIGRQLGKFVADFKRASNEFQNQLNDEVRKLEEEVEAADKPKEAADDVRTIAPPSVRPDFTAARNEFLEADSSEAETENKLAAPAKESNA